jgi:hypothetical protein
VNSDRTDAQGISDPPTGPDAAATAQSEASLPGADAAAADDARRQPSEDELKAAYEAEMSRISSAEMILQAMVSLLNIGGYRLGLSRSAGGEAGGPPAGVAHELEQVRDAIDGARALLPVLERRHSAAELRPLRDALSQLQLGYARAAGAGEGTPAAQAGAARAPTEPQPGPAPQAPAGEPKPGEPGSREPGPAESSGRLWVPGR